MEDSRKALKTYSLIYIILAVLTGILIIISFAIPDVSNNLIKSKMNNSDLHGLQPNVILAVDYVTEILVYLWVFWLLRRVTSGKSKGTFVMILLILSIILNVINLFQAYNISTMISILIDSYVIFLIYRIRKEQ